MNDTEYSSLALGVVDVMSCMCCRGVSKKKRINTPPPKIAKIGLGN